jgi:hypothetical protein
MVRALLVLSLFSGCVIRSARARDATLPYHPTLDDLRTAPVSTAAAASAASAPRTVAARLTVEPVASGYPQPVGLVYSGDGAFRKVTGVEWGSGELEQALGRNLRGALVDGDGPPIALRGGIVRLAIYRVGGEVFVDAQLELRALHDGNEIYAARYQAGARGNDRRMLLASVATALTREISRDERLFATIAGGAQ